MQRRLSFESTDSIEQEKEQIHTSNRRSRLRSVLSRAASKLTPPKWEPEDMPTSFDEHTVRVEGSGIQEPRQTFVVNGHVILVPASSR
jgi:hypothetical protein